jgi:hypothetical protein
MAILADILASHIALLYARTERCDFGSKRALFGKKRSTSRDTVGKFILTKGNMNIGSGQRYSAVLILRERVS